MRKTSFIIAVLAATLAASVARAETFSTSALKPSAVPATALSRRLSPRRRRDDLLFCSRSQGRRSRDADRVHEPAGLDKSLEIALTDPAGKRAGGHYIMGSVDANQEQARVLPIDASGRYIIRVITKGPETATFRIELGGSALANAQKPAAADAPFSRSFLKPNAMPADGVIAGQFPPTENGVITYYYVSG